MSPPPTERDKTVSNTHTPDTLVGKKVRLWSSKWLQGYADGYCTGYDRDRGVYFFRLLNARRDDPTYEVRSYDAAMFVVWADDDNYGEEMPDDDGCYEMDDESYRRMMNDDGRRDYLFDHPDDAGTWML